MHSVILLDIEGTITPISFVYETLFPFARCHLRQFLADHANDPEFGGDLDLLAAENHEDRRLSSAVPQFLERTQIDEANNYLMADGSGPEIAGAEIGSGKDLGEWLRVG